MKKKLLFTLAVGITGLSYAQCDITGLPSIMCVSDAPAAMDIDSPGGDYTGPGVEGNVFTPADAGIGIHTIDVVAPGEGYSFDESIAFAPIDIPGGTPVSLGDDAVSGDLPIGFDFTYFGNDYSSFRISSNGFITFPPETDNGCCSGENMPNASTSEPQNNIAFAWEDLDPGNGGAPAVNLVRYETVGVAPNRVLVVEFFNVDHFSSGDRVFCHTQLYETSNCIEIHLGSQPATTGNHTLGIQNLTGTEAYTAPGKNATTWTATDYAISFCPNVGCTGTIDVQVVAAPNVSGSADVEEICLGEELTLTAAGTADEYYWGVTIEDGIAFTPMTAGAHVYVVSGTDLVSGCVATALVEVFVHDIPFVDAGPDTSYCSDWEFAVEAIIDDPEVTLVWDNGAVDGELMLQDVGTVTYTVLGTNAGGCESTSEVTIESFEIPTGTGEVFDMTGMGYDGEIDFTPTGGTGGPYTFLWSNGQTTEDISSLPVGSYTVTVSDGRCDSDVTFTVDSQAGIELNELGNLKVYPNPVVDMFTIEFPGTYNWTIFDNAGKIVANGQGTDKEEISMDEMAAGSYVMQVEVDGRKSTISLVKE